MAKIERQTRETKVCVEVRAGLGPTDVRVSDRFLAHMVETLARYAGLEVSLVAEGDLRHHLVEDVAIALGTALSEEVPESAERYGWANVPMDDALVQVAIDLGGRSYFCGRLPSKLYTHFLRSLAFNMGATLHVQVTRGRDRHHVVEAAFKATGLALRQALHSGDSVFSTKGAVKVRRSC
jgi:imidazoleglycerol-phosphate dehydratase